MKKFEFKELLSRLGGDLKVAERLDVRPATVRSWVREGVPENRIEQITKLEQELNEARSH